MTPHLYATQKLWIRRWIALGEFLYKAFNIPINIILWIVRFPKWYVQNLIECTFETVFLTLLFGLFSFMSYVVYNDTQLEKPATSKQIQEVMEIDSCTKHTMVIRAKQKSEPLTFRDVRRVKLDCESYWEKQRILKEQQKTLTGK